MEDSIMPCVFGLDSLFSNESGVLFAQPFIGRYNIHGTQFIVVPVEQVEGPQGLLEELDSQLSHEEHHQAVVAPATPATQPPATRTTRLNATHPSSSSPTPAPVDPGHFQCPARKPIASAALSTDPRHYFRATRVKKALHPTDHVKTCKWLNNAGKLIKRDAKPPLAPESSTGLSAATTAAPK
ncbi:unnamed protein product [Bemisia tabaci]|uniref:Uncharacterized protein n=1 Tax=Bemisia tabaci TaxID=7038 RepID=A0A9P0A8B5_BEMTA|nr:unnamed protein product [Bemisia tabaci]